MPLSMETLRVRLGLAPTDTSRDDEITRASGTAMALMELYCDRKFPVADETEIFAHLEGSNIQLRRYPIITVTGIRDANGQEVTAYHVSRERGIIRLDGYRNFHEVTVEYSGGYLLDEFPADLAMAFYTLFDTQVATGGGGGGLAAGAIQSVTLDDVGTVRYATGAAAEAAASGQTFLDPITASILDLYRRRHA